MTYFIYSDRESNRRERISSMPNSKKLWSCKGEKEK